MISITTFDNSMLSAFKRCPTYFYYRYVLDLVTEASNFNTDFKAQFGTAFHHAMDEWFANKGIDATNAAFIKHWLPFEGVDPMGLRTLAKGLKLLEDYSKAYPREHEPFKVKYIEIGFNVELGSYIYCGRMDKVVDHPNLGGLVVLDHKTSGSKGFLSIKPNSALDGYIWGASQLLHKPLVGGCLDQIYFWKTKKNELLREYTTRTETELLQWKKECEFWMDLVNVCAHQSLWPKNTNACKDFGRECEFKMLCSSECSETNKNLIEQYYQVDRWEPVPDCDRKEVDHVQA